ncbi:MAG TPA: helix-turn-helix transcriptional regulator [Phycisphaerae bacterium]|nr:helix-turn-helix transcriptional regulator [Phycisphaerae bacterium]
MSISTLEIKGQKFVLIPRNEFDDMVKAIDKLPEIPPADDHGFRPALPAIRAIIARKLIHRRMALGMTQSELAHRACIRIETLSRLESGKHKPHQETLLRLDDVLTAAEKKSRK